MSSITSSQVIAITVAIGVIVAVYIYKTTKPKPTKTKSLKTKYGDNRLMKLNSTKQIELKLPPKFALVTDLDHTLFGCNPDESHNESNEHIIEFNDIWCTQYATNNCVLIYATGRNFEKYELAVTEWDILKPDILVCQDGVSIYWFNKSLAQQVQSKSTHKIDMTFDDRMDTTQFLWYDRSWEATLSEGWDQKFAEQIHDEVNNKYKLLKLPPKSKSLEPFRIGILCQGEDLAKEIERYYNQRIKEYNEENKDKIGFISMKIHSFTCIERNMKNNNAYWSAFTPQRAGKGSAIEFLRKRLQAKEGDIICMGDSGNDISMLGIDGYNSVIMANSSNELMKFYNEKNDDDTCNIIKTKKQKTLGVIEGLNYFGPRLLKR